MSMPDESPVPMRRGSTLGTAIAWVMILAFTGLVARVQMFQPDPAVEAGRLEQAMLEFQARYLVGSASLLGEQAAEPLERQIESWRPPSAWQQTRVAILAGELIGAEAALERLRAVETSPQVADDPIHDPAVHDALVRLYEDYSADRLGGPSVAEEEREQLRRQLGWLGKLALAPPGSDTPQRQQVIATARRTFYAVIGGVAAIGLVGLIGSVVLVAFVVLLLRGAVSGLQPAPQRSGVYAEGFACWLVLFLALSAVAGLLFGPEAVGAAALLPMVGSMLAFGWPLVRGVSWKQLCEDVGWTRGRRLGVELAAGFGCYAMAIPLVFAAVILTGIALGLAGNGAPYNGTRGHPAADWLAYGTWWEQAQLLLLACVIAPVVEETAFRGLLYRHLRDATRRMRLWSSTLLSALVSSLLFALLHPQGILAVPVLTGIALALAFMREWRGTLVPSIFAHGLNNALVMAVLIMTLSA